ncbi:unnamed protein product [Trichobilharzia regenti]|nr:unnamed protein product [Trichobilharzia regenti]
MKDTHWDPIFRQLAQLLSNRLLEVCYSRTNLPGDLWGLSKLQKVHLEGDIKARNNCHVDANSGSSSSSSRPCSKIRLFLKYFNENNHNNSDSGGGTESQCIVNLEKVTLTTKQPMSPCFLQPYIQMHQERLEPYNCPMKSQNGYHIAERNHGYLPVNLSQCYTMDLPLNSSSNIPLIPRVDNPPILDLLQMTDYTKPSLWNVNNLTNTPNDLNSRLLRLLNLQAFNNRLGFLNNTQFLNNLVHKEYQSLLNLINILSCSKYQHLLTETCHTTPYSNPLHMNRLLLTTDELSMKAADTLFNRHNCIHNESSTILKNALSTPLKTLDFSHRRDDANFENSFLIYQPLLTQINNNFSRANYNLMRANHLPFYRPIHPVHLQPRVVFNVLSPNSTSVDQLNFLLKTVSPSNKRYCRLDMLFVQDEAKTRFMCQVSQYCC